MEEINVVQGQPPEDSHQEDLHLPRRRRKKRKPPYKAIAICAGVIFLVGFLLGFLLRGLFFPKEPEVVYVEVPTPVMSQPMTNAVRGDWELILVNHWNSLPDGYTFDRSRLSNGLEVDSRCYGDLTDMLAAMEAQGLKPIVCSAYRPVEEQQALYEEKVAAYVSEGYSQEEAEEKAGTVVAVPGTSEHHLGLAVDIVDESYQLLDEKQEQTGVQQWLLNKSWEYGFILRYPNDKSSVTGIIYEPWHYRYVGKEIAREIHEKNVTLEEYLQLPISD